MRPSIRFKLNRALDERIALDFLNVRAGGVNFSQGVLGPHPELARALRRRGRTSERAVISRYARDFYQEHGDYLRRRAEQFQREWDQVARRFSGAAGRLFPGHPWPRGRYIGYVSIFNCNPRFLRDKTFQVFYAHPDGARYVTPHELLHFLFYDYCQRRHRALFRDLDPNSGVFWDLAELFNSVVLHSPTFIRVHGRRRAICYPEHRRYLPAARRLWARGGGTDHWIPAMLELLTAPRN